MAGNVGNSAMISREAAFQDAFSFLFAMQLSV
jgi:hypothetical protein